MILLVRCIFSQCEGRRNRFFFFQLLIPSIQFVGLLSSRSPASVRVLWTKTHKKHWPGWSWVESNLSEMKTVSLAIVFWSIFHFYLWPCRTYYLGRSTMSMEQKCDKKWFLILSPFFRCPHNFVLFSVDPSLTLSLSYMSTQTLVHCFLFQKVFYLFWRLPEWQFPSTKQNRAFCHLKQQQ